jgi:hypothetical protein
MVFSGLAEDQMVIWLGRQRRVKIDHPVFCRSARWCHPDQHEAGHALAQFQGLLPDVQHVVRTRRHQDAGAGRFQQRSDVLDLQQEVDRYRVAGRLGTPQRGVCLDQGGSM